jgi:hypothetical protein
MKLFFMGTWENAENISQRHRVRRGGSFQMNGFIEKELKSLKKRVKSCSSFQASNLCVPAPLRENLHLIAASLTMS